MLKYFTWNREGGHVLVIPFKNGTSVAVSTKVFATKRGALSAGARIDQRCTLVNSKTGAHTLWGKENLPWFTCDAKTGERTDHFTRVAIGNI